MKTTLHIRRNRSRSAPVGVLAAFCLATTALSADHTSAAPGPAQTNAVAAEAAPAPATATAAGKHSLSLFIGGSEGTREPLPKDILDRLAPEQIMKLEEMRRDSPKEDLIGAVAFFTCVALIVFLVVAFRFKRAREVQTTLRLMIEKGTPIPPELLTPPEPRRRAKSDLRGGLVLSGLGLGLAIFLLVRENDAWALGIIPLLMGVGLLITWKVESKKTQ